MPEIPITNAEVNGQDRHRLVLSIIENVMLWPHDEEMRRRAWQAAVIELFLQDMERGRCKFDLTVADMAEFARIVQNGPRKADIEGEAAEAFAIGVATGSVLFEAVGGMFLGLRNKELGRLKQKAVDILRLGALKTFNNSHWPRMRGVAPLWAAFYGHAGSAGDKTFPCKLDRLPMFLAEARFYAEKATSARMKQSPTASLLPPDEIWRAPEEIVLPTVEITWQLK